MGKIFEDRFKVFVFYQGADRSIRYIRMEQALHRVHYDNNTVSPIMVPLHQVAHMPRLKRVSEADDYEWEWEQL